MGHYLDIVIKDMRTHEFIVVCSKGLHYKDWQNRQTTSEFNDFYCALKENAERVDTGERLKLDEITKGALLRMQGKEWMRSNLYFEDPIADEMLLLTISNNNFIRGTNRNGVIDIAVWDISDCRDKKARFDTFVNGYTEIKRNFDNDFEDCNQDNPKCDSAIHTDIKRGEIK